MSDALRELTARSQAEAFVGFRCWRPDDVGGIMHREAAVPSPEVLLATHQPPHINRVSILAGGQFVDGDVIDQDECLAGILADTDTSLLAPIIGEPGTGKSHLVLWMKAKLEKEASPNRRIIYLPKGETSLSRVIDLLLDGRTGGDFDKIRDSVANATQQMSVRQQAEALREALAVAISAFDLNADDPSLQATLDYVAAVAADLPKLLRDPAYDHRLLDDGAVLHRIVDEARSGAREEPAEIRPEDLHVTLTDVEVGKLSEPARLALSDLSDPTLHQTAITMLNKVLPRALSRVFGVAPMQLVGVMRQLRERLLAETPGLELILMIEDFTLLQGIQYDLLEVMIEIQRREGRDVMCPMKTIMAVTRGFLRRMLTGNDGLRTRIEAQQHVYSLDVGYGGASEDDMDPDALIDFAGRYLNAVRLGEHTIEASAPALPNACDSCRHQDRCIDAFGSAPSTGFGLYPFNGPTLDRMVRGRQARFNPRDLLSMVGNTLTTRLAELEDGRFPTHSWAQQFDARDHGRPLLPTLPYAAQEAVEQLPRSEQREVLLTFWGGAPQELRNLASPIHQAFSVPEVPGIEVFVPGEIDRRKRVKPKLESVDAITREVLAWRDGARLEAARARIIRRTFRQAILGQLDPEGSLYSPQLISATFDADEYVSIENAGGAGRPGPGRFTVQLEASNTNAMLFDALLHAQTARNWSIPSGAPILAQFMVRVEQEADRLRAFINDRLEQQRADRDAYMALLAMSGVAAGQGGASSEYLLLAAAFSTPAVLTTHTPETWRALVRMTQDHQRGLRDFVLHDAHISKDTPEPLALDGQALMPSLRELGRTWELPTLGDASKGAETVYRVLTERLAGALDHVVSELTEWRAALESLIGEAGPLDKRLRKWQAALDEAEAGGFLVAAGQQSRNFSDARPDATFRAVSELLAQWEGRSLGARVAAAAKAPWARLTPVRDGFVSLQNTMEASIRQAETQVGAAAATEALQTLQQRLDELAKAARIQEP